MHATEVLREQHDVIRDLLRRLSDTSTHQPERRRLLVDQLMAELQTHEQIEDEIFYPAMRDVSVLVPIGHAEHRQLDDQLAVLLCTNPVDERFAEQLRILAALIEHHAGAEEESRMFPEIRRRVGEAELARVGDRLATRLAQLRRSRLVAARLRLKRRVLRADRRGGLALMAVVALLALAGCASSASSSGPRVQVVRIQAAMHEPAWSDHDGVLLGLTETGSRVEKVDRTPTAHRARSAVSRSFRDIGENLAASLPDKGLVYVPQPRLGRVAVLNVANLRQVGTLRDGPSPRYLGTDIGAKALLALSANGRTVTGIDLQDKRIVASQHVPGTARAELVGPERERKVEYHLTGPDGIAHYEDGERRGAIDVRSGDAVGDQTKVTRLYVAELETDRLLAIDSQPSGDGLRVVGHADLGAPVEYVGVDQYMIFAATEDRLVVLATNSFEGYSDGNIPIYKVIHFRAGMPSGLRHAPLSGLAVGPDRVWLTFSGKPYVASIPKPGI